MDATVSDRSPCSARPLDPRSSTVPDLRHLAGNLPSRALLRTLALALTLCAMAALLSGAAQARVMPDAPLLGPDAGAMAISITCPKDIDTSTDGSTCSATVPFAAEATSPGCKLLGIGYAIGTTQITSPYNFKLGTTTVTAGALDSCQNEATCTFRVTIIDKTQPQVICPANITTSADSNKCTARVSFAGTATDNCSVASVKYLIGASQITSPYDFPVGTTTVTMEARDASSNVGSCSFQVTVRDNQPPAIVCPANVTTAAGPGACTASGAFAATTTDNCGVASLKYAIGATAITSPYDFPVGTSTVQAEVRDGSDNSATCSFQVTVHDTQPPSIACPADMTMSNAPGRCSAPVSYAAPASSDNCTATVLCSPASGSTFPLGATQVSCQARDPSNNSATCIFAVTVRDTEPPAVTCPADVTVSADSGGCTAGVAFAASAADNCALQSLTYEIGGSQISSPYDFALGTTTVSARARDGNNNTSTCTFRVTVRDNQPPAIVCPANVTLSADSGACTAGVTFAATASDNCGVASLKYSIGAAEIASPYDFPVGTSTVKAEARDAANNAASCTFQVTVDDTQPPSIACPADVTVSNDPGRCSAAVSPPAPNATDNCGAVSLVMSPPSGSVFPVGTTNVMATAGDQSSNSATCTFGVTVRDTEAPAISCPADVTVNADAGGCTAGVAFAASAADNCSVQSLTYDIGGTQISSPHDFTLGTTTVTARARDASNNTGTCSFRVTVRDTRPPDITCPGNLYGLPPADRCSATLQFTATATDDCGVPSLQYYVGATEIHSPYDFSVGETTVTARAVDAGDNVAECTFLVTVRDHQDPRLTCPGTLSYDSQAGQCSATVPLTVTASDNCTIAWTRFYVGGAEIPNPYTFPVGVTGVTVRVADGVGNPNSCEFQVRVRDRELPAVTCPSDIAVDVEPGGCSATVPFAAMATDNCDMASLQYFVGSTEIHSPYGFSLGATTVRAEVRDAAGNSNQCTFAVSVRDTQPPGLTCPSDMAVNTDAGLCSATVPFAVTAMDNCAMAWLRYYSGTTEIRSPYTFTLGTTTVRVAASDTVSNTAECNFHVTVRDSERPAITCPPTVRTAPDPGTSYASHVAVGTATATDACAGASVTAVRGDGQGLADPYPLGRTVITWTARDAAGNASSCTQEVWVEQGPLRLYLPCLLRQ